VCECVCVRERESESERGGRANLAERGGLPPSDGRADDARSAGVRIDTVSQACARGTVCVCEREKRCVRERERRGVCV